MELRSFTLFLVLTLLMSGCISRKSTGPAPLTYVTPCNIAALGSEIRVNSDSLNTVAIKDSLEMVFVDNFNHPAAGETMRKSYVLNCYWGNLVGEKRDYYYCAGRYNAPELDDNQVIQRFVWKNFKIGFTVEEHNVGTWRDSAGVMHNEGSVYYLSVRSVDGTCYLGNYVPPKRR